MSATKKARTPRTPRMETNMSTKAKKYYKVLTHDLRPPVQGGEPVFDGTLPFTLPTVNLDTSDDECGAGWNFCSDGARAMQIAGYWPNGRACRMFEIEPATDMIVRKNKCRASSGVLIAELSEREIAGLMHTNSAQWFGDEAEEMQREQLAWRWVLGEGFTRPESLEIRKATWDERDAWHVWDAWYVWDAWHVGDAWNAWNAWHALVIYYVCTLRNRVPLPPSCAWLADVGGVQNMIPEGVLSSFDLTEADYER